MGGTQNEGWTSISLTRAVELLGSVCLVADAPAKGAPSAISSASYGAIDPELILSAGDGYFYDFWADYDMSGTPVDADIVYRYSTDGGENWLPQSPTVLSVGQSYSLRPSACRHEGVVWEDYRNGNWEIYFDSPE